MEYKTQADLDQERTDRHAAVDDVLRMLKMLDCEPVANVEDVMLLAEYVRTGEVCNRIGPALETTL